MKSKSIKKNFIMNMMLTTSNYIFPLITFPYLSRILLASGNGKIGFATSVVNYAIMFASLGIPMYGIKACAKVRDDRKMLSKTTQELFLFNTITAVITCIILMVLLWLLPQFEGYRELILISAMLIPLQTIGVEWLFKAMEEYSYITMRALVFRIMGIILMFLLVKTPDDCATYVLINVIGTGGSMLLNAMNVHKYVDRVELKICELTQHIKPVVVFFALSASWTIYTNLDVVMLGLISTDIETGYYSAAIKVKSILAGGISALGTVLLPRLSNYYYEKKSEFYRLLKVNFQFVVILAFPLALFFTLTAENVMLILSGDSFLSAVPAMKAIIWTLIPIGLSNVLGTGFLVPMGKEKVTIIATVCGIVTDVIFNALWIAKYGALGAACATVVGEIVIVIIEIFYLRKEFAKIYSASTFFKVILACLFSGIVSICICMQQGKFMDSFIYMIVLFCVFTLCYLTALLVLREKFTCDIVKGFVQKVSRCVIKK